MFPEISQFLNSPLFHSIVSIARIVFIVVSALLFGFVIFGLVYTTWLKRLILWDLQEFFTERPYGVKKLYRQWQKIKQRLGSGLESEYKLAVVEADSALDSILKKRGFTGETLGERLEKLTEATIANLSEVLEAHKTRNNIVHDPDFNLTLDETKRALDVYEKALTDLQAL
ncbi:MAG: hypothetical protein ABH813_01940 [Patescibacteria group bacterium]